MKYLRNYELEHSCELKHNRKVNEAMFNFFENRKKKEKKHGKTKETR